MKKFKFKSVVSLANSKLSIKFAAVLLSASTLISALLGIFRDRLLNSYYLDVLHFDFRRPCSEFYSGL